MISEFADCLEIEWTDLKMNGNIIMGLGEAKENIVIAWRENV